ncbi:MAG: hypothetical protein K0R61_3615 [Microvirga sp.]|jgi:hypothetical protein|nr:hypothetical protein [Microvirga sp.]
MPSWSTNDYDLARSRHERLGGYLLELDDGRYAVCDGDEALQLGRTREQLDYLDHIAMWNEVELSWAQLAQYNARAAA